MPLLKKHLRFRLHKFILHEQAYIKKPESIDVKFCPKFSEAIIGIFFEKISELSSKFRICPFGIKIFDLITFERKTFKP